MENLWNLTEKVMKILMEKIEEIENHSYLNGVINSSITSYFIFATLSSECLGTKTQDLVRLSVPKPSEDNKGLIAQIIEVESKLRESSPESVEDLKHYVNKNKNYKDKELDKAFLFSAKSFLSLGDTISATKYYNLATDNLKKQNLNEAVLQDIENYFIMVKDFNGAIKIADLKIMMNPNSDQPYVTKGNYYLISGDTLKAIENWEIAFKKFNGNFNIAMTLSGYFRGKGDVEKAD